MERFRCFDRFGVWSCGGGCEMVIRSPRKGVMLAMKVKG